VRCSRRGAEICSVRGKENADGGEDAALVGRVEDGGDVGEDRAAAVYRNGPPLPDCTAEQPQLTRRGILPPSAASP
jgi:hypothetical protein